MHSEQKKDKEVYIVRGFLKTLRLKGRVKPQENPDVRVALCQPNAGWPAVAGVEVREHYNDEILGKLDSQGQRLWKFWWKVREKVEQIRPDALSQIHAFVQLKKRNLLKQKRLNSIIKGIAKEIVDFVVNGSENGHSNIIIVPDWEERHFGDFMGYPLMEKYVKRVTIRKGFYGMFTANANASIVGVSITNLRKIIEEKNQKAQKYNRMDLDELWLLIAAPHDNAFNAMHGFPEQINFGHTEIMEACQRTPFDRIFFWSGPPHEWYRKIWPKEP